MKPFIKTASVLILLLVATIGRGQGLDNFKISEVVVNNQSGLIDEYGERSAWIEITNTSWSTTNLSGCYITSDPSVLDESLTAPQRIAKMCLISKGDARTSIAPKNQVVFFADGKQHLGTLHTNFTLTPGQENFVALFEGNGVKMIDCVTIPATLEADHSWSRFGFGKKVEPVWKDCPPNLVTPNSANDNTVVKQDKVKEWKEKDPHGVAMSILGMGIVLGGLVLLWFFFSLFGAVFRRSEKKAEAAQAASASEAPAKEAVAPKADDMTTIMSVIAMALYEELDAHDEESGVITIVPTHSHWGFHELEMVEHIHN